MTQAQRPAAALDLFTTTSGSNEASDKYYFFTYWTLATGTSLLLTIYLNESKEVMNAWGSFMSFTDAFQSVALGFLVALSESISL